MMTTEAGTTNKAEQIESEHNSDYRLCRTPHHTRQRPFSLSRNLTVTNSVSVRHRFE